MLGHRALVPFVVGIVVGFALACGSASDSSDAGSGVDESPDAGEQFQDGGTSAPVGLPLDAACSLLNGRRCGYLQRCGLVPPGGDAQRECAQYFAATACGPQLWPARVSEGTLIYDGTQAQACAEAWDLKTCDDFDREPPACRALHVPAAPLGGVCLGGPARECKEGSCTGGTCPRRCRVAGAAGEVCERDGDCVSGLFCRRSPSSGTVGTCSAFAAAGESCDEFRPCGEDLYCGEFSLCNPVRQAGESCDPGTCAESTWCAPSADGGVCTESGDLDAPCSTDEQCASNLLCLKETGRCGSPGPLPMGADCTLRQRCADGLTCVGTSSDPQRPGVGTCQSPGDEGAPCDSSFDCAAPWACDTALDGGTCAPRAEDGATCLADRECRLFSRCMSGVCTPLPRPGEACAGQMCLYGTCTSADGGWTCSGLAGTGSPCTRDLDCRSLQCVSGACLPACSP